MKVVASNSAEDLAADAVRAELRWRAKALTANLMRIARGSGKPLELEGQLCDLVLAFDAAGGTNGRVHAPTVVAEALDIQRPYDFDDPLRHRNAAEQMIVLGALRMVAGRYVDQHLQAGAGEDQMLNGIHAFERAQEDQRRAAREANRLHAAAAKKAKARRK